MKATFTRREHRRANKILSEIEERIRSKVVITIKGGECMAGYHYIRSSGIRKLVKENNKRCGAEFLDELNMHVYDVVCRCVRQFNGHRTTLDRTVLKLVTGEIQTRSK